MIDIIDITDVLDLIKKLKSDEFKDAVKKYGKKVSDIKTTKLRNTGEVAKLKYEIMANFNSIDKLNITSFDEMTDIVNETAKQRETASKIFRVKLNKLKVVYKAGNIDATEYAKQIKNNKNALRFTEKTIESNYLTKWMKNINRTNMKKKVIFKDIFQYKQELELAKKTRNKNVLIGIGITIAVISAIAVAIKVYTIIMKKLKSPCRSIEDSEDKNRCEIHSEIDALNAKMVILQDQGVKCELSEDPFACNEKIDKEINSIKSKVDLLKTKLDNL